MLQKLREKTTGWIATVILGLLIIPFAFFGVDQYMSQSVDDYVAKIEAPPTWWKAAPSWWPVSMLWQSEEISGADFRERYEQTRQDQQQRMGEAFDVRAFESVENKREILDSLIDERVLRMTSNRAGIAIGTAQIQETIAGIEAFQVDGKFDQQRYELALATQVPARTAPQFENMVRESLQQSLLPTAIGESAFVTSGELDRLLKLLGETRDVGYVRLSPPTPDTGAISGGEIDAWYKAHVQQYRAPETVAIEYVEIDAAAMPVATADEAALRQRYEQEKARFVEPDQRLASHILVRVATDADAATQKAAEQKAAQLATQAKAAGADFAALARANSDDTGSKEAGGDLGWVEKNGTMVKPFEDALFAMQAAGVSAPVKTDYGWHVIQLREIKTGQQSTFEQAREQLAIDQAEADRERAFNDLTGKLVDLVYKNPTALTPAARQLNLPVQTLGPFARGAGTGIAANPAVLRAAFSETLIQDGTVSDPIELAPNHSVLIRVTQHDPERAQPLAQVRDQVIAAIRVDRAAKALAARADTMLAQLRAGNTLEQVASGQQLVPTEVQAVPRGAPMPEPVATEAYFAVPAPAAGKSAPGKVTLADGGIAVFVVRKVLPGNPATASAQERALLQQQLARSIGIDDARAFAAAMRKQMRIEVAEDRL